MFPRIQVSGDYSSIAKGKIPVDFEKKMPFIQIARIITPSQQISKSCFNQHVYYDVQMTLTDLLENYVPETHLQDGGLVAHSVGTKCDRGYQFAFVNDHFHLALNKDIYESFGIIGLKRQQSASFPSPRFAVYVNVNSGGKKLVRNLKSSLKRTLNDRINMRMACETDVGNEMVAPPTDAVVHKRVVSASSSEYLGDVPCLEKIHKEMVVEGKKKSQNDVQKVLMSCWEWLGLLGSDILTNSKDLAGNGMHMDEKKAYISSFSCPSPNSLSKVGVYEICGLIVPSAMRAIIDTVRQKLNSDHSQNSWCAVQILGNPMISKDFGAVISSLSKTSSREESSSNAEEEYIESGSKRAMTITTEKKSKRRRKNRVGSSVMAITLVFFTGSDGFWSFVERDN